jgi:hypothetical protein
MKPEIDWTVVLPRARAMAEQGYSAKAIAGELGVPLISLRNRMYQSGMKSHGPRGSRLRRIGRLNAKCFNPAMVDL